MTCSDCARLAARVAELEGALVKHQRIVLTDELPKEALVRFWAKVDRTGGEDLCWPWLARSERFHLTKQQAISPRRLSWRIAFGDAPLEIAMACRNKVCVNPAHMVRTELQKFWSLVAKVDGDGCWEWQGGINGTGYGVFAPKTNVAIAAHRYAYEATYGVIEGHLHHVEDQEISVCHHCDNPRCVRPDHLFLGSDADNTADKVAKGRQAKGKALSEAVRKANEARRNMQTLAEKAMGMPTGSEGGQ